MKIIGIMAPVLAGLVLMAASGPAMAQTVLQPGEPAQGRLESGDRRSGGKYQDVWSFQARRGETYTIDLLSTDFDPFLRVEGPRGFRETNDDGGGGLNSRIRFTASADGVVRVVATSYSDSTGRYTLLVHDSASQARAAAPRSIAPGQTVTGRLNAASARLANGKFSESWTFQAQAGQRYTVTLTSPDFDTYVSVLGPGGLSGENNNHGGVTDSRLDFVAPQSGVVTLVATSSATGATGGYALSLTPLSAEQAAAADLALCDNVRAVRAERLAACEARLRAAAALGEDARAEAHAARGRAHYSAGNYLNAIIDYETAGRLSPALADGLRRDHAYALHDLGAQYFDANPPDNGQAFTYFDRAIAMRPDYSLAYSNRGQVYGRWGLHDMALADLNRGIEMAPDTPRPWEVRGTYYLDNNNLSAARADYDRAIALNPDYERGYRARGLMFRDQGQHTAAIADFSQVLRINPRNEVAWRMRGWSRFDLRDWANAETDFAQATGLARTADGFYGLGAARHNLGRYTEALAAYDVALSINPNHADARHNRQQLGQFVQAESERDRRYQQCLEQQRNRQAAQERRAVGDAAIGLFGLLSGASAADVRDAQQMDRAITGAAPGAPVQCVR